MRSFHPDVLHFSAGPAISAVFFAMAHDDPGPRNAGPARTSVDPDLALAD
jgi:hypothetical protein